MPILISKSMCIYGSICLSIFMNTDRYVLWYQEGNRMSGCYCQDERICISITNKRIITEPNQLTKNKHNHQSFVNLLIYELTLCPIHEIMHSVKLTSL